MQTLWHYTSLPPPNFCFVKAVNLAPRGHTKCARMNRITVDTGLKTHTWLRGTPSPVRAPRSAFKLVFVGVEIFVKQTNSSFVCMWDLLFPPISPRWCVVQLCVFSRAPFCFWDAFIANENLCVWLGYSMCCWGSLRGLRVQRVGVCVCVCVYVCVCAQNAKRTLLFAHLSLPRCHGWKPR